MLSYREAKSKPITIPYDIILEVCQTSFSDILAVYSNLLSDLSDHEPLQSNGSGSDATDLQVYQRRPFPEQALLDKSFRASQVPKSPCDLSPAAYAKFIFGGGICHG